MGKHHLPRIRAALVAICGAVTISVVAASPAHAAHGAMANSGVLNTPNWQICVFIEDGAEEGIDAVAYGISEINRSDVNAARFCRNINVTLYAGSFPDSWFGVTICGKGLLINGVCSSKGVSLNSRTITTQSQWQKSAAHELGHVAGLGHRNTNNSCMTSGASPPIVATLDSHDLAAINATY